MFGGESGASEATATPVAPDFWELERPDVFQATEDSYTWKRFTAYAQGPTGRSRPAIGYSIDDGSVLVMGGDTSGTNAPGGQSNAIWVVPEYYSGTTVNWRLALRRDFLPTPPAIAGMGLVALGEGQGSHRPQSGAVQFRRKLARRAGLRSAVWRMADAHHTRFPERAPNRGLPEHLRAAGRPAVQCRTCTTTDPNNSQSTYKRFFNLQTKQWEDPSPWAQQDVIFFGASAMFRRDRSCVPAVPAPSGTARLRQRMSLRVRCGPTPRQQ
jgi:hypothetical protein